MSALKQPRQQQQSEPRSFRSPRERMKSSERKCARPPPYSPARRRNRAVSPEQRKESRPFQMILTVSSVGEAPVAILGQPLASPSAAFKAKKVDGVPRHAICAIDSAVSGRSCNKRRSMECLFLSLGRSPRAKTLARLKSTQYDRPAHPGRRSFLCRGSRRFLRPRRLGRNNGPEITPHRRAREFRDARRKEADERMREVLYCFFVSPCRAETAVTWATVFTELAGPERRVAERIRREGRSRGRTREEQRRRNTFSSALASGKMSDVRAERTGGDSCHDRRGEGEKQRERGEIRERDRALPGDGCATDKKSDSPAALGTPRPRNVDGHRAYFIAESRRRAAPVSGGSSRGSGGRRFLPAALFTRFELTVELGHCERRRGNWRPAQLRVVKLMARRDL